MQVYPHKHNNKKAEREKRSPDLHFCFHSVQFLCRFPPPLLTCFFLLARSTWYIHVMTLSWPRHPNSKLNIIMTLLQSMPDSCSCLLHDRAVSIISVSLSCLPHDPAVSIISTSLSCLPHDPAVSITSVSLSCLPHDPAVSITSVSLSCLPHNPKAIVTSASPT